MGIILAPLATRRIEAIATAICLQFCTSITFKLVLSHLYSTFINIHLYMCLWLQLKTQMIVDKTAV